MRLLRNLRPVMATMAALPLLSLPSASAHAHPGGHDHLGSMALLMHHAEPYHLIPAALVIVAAVLGLRHLTGRAALRRVASRRQAFDKTRGDRR